MSSESSASFDQLAAGDRTFTGLAPDVNRPRRVETVSGCVRGHRHRALVLDQVPIPPAGPWGPAGPALPAGPRGSCPREVPEPEREVPDLLEVTELSFSWTDDALRGMICDTVAGSSPQGRRIVRCTQRPSRATVALEMCGASHCTSLLLGGTLLAREARTPPTSTPGEELRARRRKQSIRAAESLPLPRRGGRPRPPGLSRIGESPRRSGRRGPPDRPARPQPLPGPVDGIEGPQTASAVRQFQRRKQVPVTV